ncbi:hypothetical protein BKA62DRAFT_711907 [Auriculariales sp. MPI-PUGE-AT-0066]|nr:hypothetical protein BKA62DRAFT_711907 [Auriculariales sp. MPI-PUGE-AT-0066]
MANELVYTLAQLAAENPALPVLLALIVFLSPLVLLRFLSAVPDAGMVLESLGLGALFGWGNNTRSDTEPSSEKRKLKKKTRHSRGRSDDLPARHESSGDIYPGLVNVSGTYCFMNSTLQALASLSYLQPQIDDMHQRAVELDVPTPVIDAVREILHQLNTPHHHRRAFRPMAIIDALSNPGPGQKQSMLFNSMQHQDAQELFQLVSECIKNEATALDKEASSRLRGLAGALVDESAKPSSSIGVFDGLTANRRSCVDCGYTEAVMHFSFDNWTLAVPRAQSCRLEDCLAEYTKLEVLTDCICRRCSMIATLERVTREVDRLAAAVALGAVGVEEKATSSRKKRLREARKQQALIKSAIDEGRVEDDIPGVKLERVFAQASTKQAMIARPPPVLAMHLNRSMHFGYGGANKNSCPVYYPEYLDLTPFSTSGKLSTRPDAPISAHGPNARSITPTPSSQAARVLYRLQAIVCHYGAHSFGHYVAFRRKPVKGSPPPPRIPTASAGVVSSTASASAPWLSGSASASTSTSHNDGRWLRISDDSVEEVSLAQVLAETSSAFMLYYERVPPSRPPMHGPADSEETLRPPKLRAESTETLSPPPEDGEEVQPQPLQRSRSVARVVHAYDRGRASRSPSVFEVGAGNTTTTNAMKRSEESLVASTSSLSALVSTSSASSVDTEVSSVVPSPDRREYLAERTALHLNTAATTDLVIPAGTFQPTSLRAQLSPGSASTSSIMLVNGHADSKSASEFGDVTDSQFEMVSSHPHETASARSISPAPSNVTSTTASSATPTPGGSGKRKRKGKAKPAPVPQVVDLRA